MRCLLGFTLIFMLGASAGTLQAETPIALPPVDAASSAPSAMPYSAVRPVERSPLLPVQEFAREESAVILTGHADQAVPVAPAPPMPYTNTVESDDPVAVRLEQLEAETAALREEISALRSQPAAVAPPAPAADPKKFAWVKGDYKIVPYGSLWMTMAYDTERTFPGEYPLFVESPTTAGEPGFELDIRRTRLGLDVTGPDIAFFNAASSGKVEIDFFGNFLQTENRAGVLLRHAYWQVKNDEYRLLVGQYWDLISPLYTNTISYSVGWYGGNIGYRRAQVLLDRYLTFSDISMVTLSLSANQDIVTDFPTEANVNREPVDWPVMEGRIGWTLGQRGKGCNPITMGVSSHIGKQGFDFRASSGSPLFLPPVDDVQLITWSFNTDLRVPITDRFGFENELFMGENLGTFLGGIGQGTCFCSRQPIRSRGGWFDVWYNWTPRMRSYFGAGIDDPYNQDMFVGRTYNHFIFGNVVYDITSQCQVGFEVSNWETHFKDNRTPQSVDPLPGDTMRLEAMAKYSF